MYIKLWFNLGFIICKFRYWKCTRTRCIWKNVICLFWPSESFRAKFRVNFVFFERVKWLTRAQRARAWKDRGNDKNKVELSVKFVNLISWENFPSFWLISACFLRGNFLCCVYTFNHSNVDAEHNKSSDERWNFILVDSRWKMWNPAAAALLLVLQSSADYGTNDVPTHDNIQIKFNRRKKNESRIFVRDQFSWFIEIFSSALVQRDIIKVLKSGAKVARNNCEQLKIIQKHFNSLWQSVVHGVIWVFFLCWIAAPPFSQNQLNTLM